MRLLRALLFLLLVAVAAAGGAAFYAFRAYDAPGPLVANRAVVVPRGSLDQVASTLEQEGVIRRGWELKGAALLTQPRGSVHAGELEFPASASLRQVLEILRTGKPIQHKLTIPEGLTSQQVAALLARAPALEGEIPPIPEGSLLPETYAYERGTSRATLIARATRAMDVALERAWSDRRPDLPLGTPQDALILASIVERETSKREERPVVAAVYLNRLRRGMRLQSDPTVVYAASGGLGVLDHGLTRSELDRDNPYNTYRRAGLPPGPICMPGLASIEAVTHPADTTDLFFVADGTGGHVFSRTEQEHARNVENWRRLERVRARQGQ